MITGQIIYEGNGSQFCPALSILRSEVTGGPYRWKAVRVISSLGGQIEIPVVQIPELITVLKSYVIEDAS